MADNASGFVDFNEFSALTQDEERRLMEEAMGRAEEADTMARRNLTRASQQAVDTGAESLTQVGSYTDYLTAKRNARDAWARVGQSTGDPRLDAVREGMARSASMRGSDSADELAGREERLGARVGEAYSSRQANAAAMDAWRRQQAEAAAQRAQQDKDAKAEHYRRVAAQLTGNIKGNIYANQVHGYTGDLALRSRQLLDAQARGDWGGPQDSALGRWLPTWARDERSTRRSGNTSGSTTWGGE